MTTPHKMPSTALYTDHYEFTMLEAALRSGIAHRRATFEVFARRLAPGRRYGVVCGTGRIPTALAAYKFEREELDFLRSAGIVGNETLQFLETFTFSGDITGYPDGELYFPNSPVLRIEGTFAETLLVETLILSILNFDSAVASAAARMSQAAKGRPLIEMGGRRSNEHAAIAAARAAYICGFAATSNVEAGRIYDIPTAGTAGHALVLAHDSETAAFEAQLQAQGSATTALVDTYDIAQGIRRAVSVFGTQLRSIRIDSGNLAEGAVAARKLLDELGAEKTGIILSGDLDEYAIDELSDAPVDGFGVGTRLVGGSGYPTANFVYKLVSIETAEHSFRNVSKRSENKETAGGRKASYRTIGPDGLALGEFTCDPDDHLPQDLLSGARALQVPVIRAGQPLEPRPLTAMRQHHISAINELPERERTTQAGVPALDVVHLHGDRHVD